MSGENYKNDETKEQIISWNLRFMKQSLEEKYKNSIIFPFLSAAQIISKELSINSLVYFWLLSNICSAFFRSFISF